MKYVLSKEDKIYQIYSAIILSVYGVTSKFSRSSILLIVPPSDLTDKTLYFEELFTAPFLFCFRRMELHILGVMGLELIGVSLVLSCH